MMQLSRHVLTGALAHDDLLAIILGDMASVKPIHLNHLSLDPSFEKLEGKVRGGATSQIPPILVELQAEQTQRLTFWTEVLAAQVKPIALPDGLATLYFDAQIAGSSLNNLDLREGHDILLALTRDIMAFYGNQSTQVLNGRLAPMLVRAAGRVRAKVSPPTTRRFRAISSDIELQQRSTPYSAFFAIEEYDLSWRQFDGRMGQPANRAVFLSGDAVTVLPYDPLRDRVLLIDQFRAGPFARGDDQPWLLEPVAGRIDPGETPEQAARREAVEEAGLQLTALLPVAQYYPTPGANSEFLYSYVALTELPDGMGGIFGLATEAEDIRTHILPFAELMQMVASGEASNAPLILTALWLERERPRLRAGNP